MLLVVRGLAPVTEANGAPVMIAGLARYTLPVAARTTDPTHFADKTYDSRRFRQLVCDRCFRSRQARRTP